MQAVIARTAQLASLHAKNGNPYIFSGLFWKPASEAEHSGEDWIEKALH
jgi:hypothetical protein